MAGYLPCTIPKHENMKRLLLLLYFSLFIHFGIEAARALSLPQTIVQKDGSCLTVFLRGDEHSHFYFTADNIPISTGDDGCFYYAYLKEGHVERSSLLAHNVSERSEEERVFISEHASKATDYLSDEWTEKMAITGMRRQTNRSVSSRKKSLGEPKPYIGDKKGLVILVNFADKKMVQADANSAFDNMFNAVGYNKNGAIGSVHDYFYDQSYGKFNLSFDVVGPVTLANGYAYYGENASKSCFNYEKVVELFKEAFYTIQNEQDKNNEYIKEMQKKEEKKRAKMFKNIFDKSFKYIYLQKNQSLVESGSEHIPYKKYISIKKFILLIIKSVIFCLINFYCTYGAVESGHNIIDLSGNMLDFRRLQINLWTNLSFIIFLENEIFTYFYTLLRIIEIAIFVIIYLIILFMYQKQNTKQTNPFNSFLLVLNFILIVIFCSLVNFGLYIIENLYDGTVVYKLRNMKILDKHLEEMKQLVDYKEEENEDDEESKNEDEKEKEKESVLEIINQDDENRNNRKVNSYIVTPIKDLNDEDTSVTKNPKIIVNRKNKKNPYNNNNNNEKDLKDSLKLADYFDRNLIQRKELKKQQIQDSINIMERNKKNIKDDENRKKKQLIYVNENK